VSIALAIIGGIVAGVVGCIAFFYFEVYRWWRDGPH